MTVNDSKMSVRWKRQAWLIPDQDIKAANPRLGDGTLDTAYIAHFLSELISMRTAKWNNTAISNFCIILNQF